jgi:hypothetical protein
MDFLQAMKVQESQESQEIIIYRTPDLSCCFLWKAAAGNRKNQKRL